MGWSPQGHELFVLTSVLQIYILLSGSSLLSTSSNSDESPGIL